jgi:hypothetical protein
MKARRKKKRAPRNAQPEWWESPTFFTRQACIYNPEKKLVIVTLILPDGVKVDLGRFTETGNPDDLHRAVALRFKEIWDPGKRCRRAPTV